MVTITSPKHQHVSIVIMSMLAGRRHLAQRTAVQPHRAANVAVDL